MDSYYTLRRGAFGKFPSLNKPDSDFYFNAECVKIANRNYMQIDSGCFENMLDLKTLTITRCKIKYVQADVFGKEKKPKLQTVDLSHNIIHTFSYIKILNAHDFKSLIHINLSHNTLTKLDAANFQNFSNLETINLSYNRISMIVSFSFKNLTSLKHIDLSYNRIDKICRDSLVNLPRLQTIDLSFNRWQDVNIFSFSSYKRNQTELTRKIEKLFKLVHYSVDKVELVNENGPSGGAVYVLMDMMQQNIAKSASNYDPNAHRKNLHCVMIRKKPIGTDNVVPFKEGTGGKSETELDFKIATLNSNIVLYLDDSFKNDALGLTVELSNDSVNYKFNRDDMEILAEEFLTNKYPNYFLEKVKITDYSARTIFDILLQEAAHKNEEFLEVLLDIIERKYKPFSEGMPFSKITLTDESLVEMVEAVNAGLNKIVLKRIFKCLTLDKEQCLTLFKMAYKINCEKLAVFVFDNCLRYQKTDKLKDIVRLYFKDMCDKNWVVVLTSMLESCKLNEVDLTYDDETGQKKDKPPEWATKYDFTYLDVDITEEDEEGGLFNHPLLHIADSNQACLLKHTTTQKLLHLKWRYYPRILYYVEISFYLTALIAYSLLFLFIIEYNRTCGAYMLLFIVNIIIFGVSLLVTIVCRGVYFIYYRFAADKTKLPKFAFLNWIDWIQVSNLLRLVSDILCMVLTVIEFTNFITVFTNTNASMTHQYGLYSFNIVLMYFLFVQRLDKVAYIGHYVQVYTQVAIKSFKLLPFLIILITGFLVSMQAQIYPLSSSDPTDFNLSLNYIWFVLFQGSLDINQLGLNNYLTASTWIYYSIIFVFIFFMTIMFFNMFIGIAAGEVSTLARDAEILYIKSVISLCFDLGELHKPIGLYDPVKYHWRVLQWLKTFQEKVLLPVVNSNFAQDGLGQSDSTPEREDSAGDVMFRLQSLENDMRTIVKEMGKLRQSFNSN